MPQCRSAIDGAMRGTVGVLATVGAHQESRILLRNRICCVEYGDFSSDEIVGNVCENVVRKPNLCRIRHIMRQVFVAMTSYLNRLVQVQHVRLIIPRPLIQPRGIGIGIDLLHSSLSIIDDRAT